MADGRGPTLWNAEARTLSQRQTWVSIDGKDNFEPLTAMSWQVHVYGSATAELSAWCANHAVPLHVFNWRPEHEAAGLGARRDLLAPARHLYRARRNG
jgi:hypothetical protein